jgi:hypothetical protein
MQIRNVKILKRNINRLWCHCHCHCLPQAQENFDTWTRNYDSGSRSIVIRLSNTEPGSKSEWMQIWIRYSIWFMCRSYLLSNIKDLNTFEILINNAINKSNLKKKHEWCINFDWCSTGYSFFEQNRAQKLVLWFCKYFYLVRIRGSVILSYGSGSRRQFITAPHLTCTFCGQWEQIRFQISSTVNN